MAREVKQGRWIAAVAREYGLTLVSRNGHFEEIEGLAVEA
jgi:predicted nucleic acid-binding protein